mmetsp:Transcript_69107/g.156257  ORF Transcript_69107/g.156257 Transcript_69107/m.156257 type:complete len:279 (+) Transcript_69107:330-1166(+)
MRLLLDDAQARAGVGRGEDVALGALEHRHHVPPAVIVRLRDHALHPKPALNAFVHIRLCHKEIFLGSAEAGQVFGDELHFFRCFVEYPSGLNAAHGVPVLLRGFDPHQVCLVRPLEPLGKLERFHMDGGWFEFPERSLVVSIDPVHEMVVHALLDLVVHVRGLHLAPEIAVRPLVARRLHLRDAEDFEGQFRVSVLLGHRALPGVAVVEALELLPERVRDVVGVVRIPPLDDVEEGLVDRIGFRVELGHVRKLEAHRPDRSGEVGEGTRSSVHSVCVP